MPKVPSERLEISEISTSDLHLNLYELCQFQIELWDLI